MKLAMIFVLVYTSAMLAACNQSSDSGLEISPEKQGADVPGFQGTWKSTDCRKWGSGDYLYSSTQTMTVKGSRIESQADDFANHTCSGPVRSTLKFKMKFDIAKSTTSEWHNIDVISSEITQTVFDQDAANLFNTSAFCGFTDWVVGVEKNISDRDCMSGAKISQTIYSIFKVADTKIQLGEPDDVNDGTTPEKRHKTLGNIFIKQN